MRPAAIVFDLYGTLLQIDALRAEVRACGIDDAAGFVDLWRHKQIEYAWCSTLMDEYRDFDTLTRRALAFVLARTGYAFAADQVERLAQGWLRLRAHDDVMPALTELRDLGVPLAVLTNGVRVSAERVLRHADIREPFDVLLSVESVRAYKPDPRVYTLVTKHFACEPERIAFVSSNGWDANGASAFGFRVAYCNRATMPAEALGFPPAVTLSGLSGLRAFLN